ncbi:hypothetical protein [Methyloglobulus sp.]|uniref:hypothetical protein n=1 Tax=Methyloglobulus sp. TaxID=2518622 RepID=UPI00398A2064
MRHKITALQHLASRLPPNVGFDPFKQPLHSQIEHLMGNVHALHNLQGNPDRLDSELGHQLKVTKKKQELLQVV